MRNTSSIFNSKTLPLAFFLTLLAIIVFETVPYRFWSQRLFHHEVDQLLYEIEHKKYDADIVLIGDSVGRQITTKLLSDQAMAARFPGMTFSNLTTNQAIEITGQYYLIQRYLKRNKKPTAILFIGLNPLGQNLDQIFTENFVKRCFTNFHEIAEIALHKGIGFAFDMFMYKFFPSYRYRLRLQNKILRFHNNAYTGQEWALQANSEEKNESSPAAFSTSALSNIYFVRLVDLLSREGISFYFLPAPLKKSTYEHENAKKRITFMKDFFHALEKTYPNFHFIDEIEVYPDTFFLDHVHLNEKSLVGAASRTQEKFSEIQKSRFK